MFIGAKMSLALNDTKGKFKHYPQMCNTSGKQLLILHGKQWKP